MALKGNQGEDFTPYLRVVADENRKYFPSAFLMHILGDEEYILDIIAKRDFGHWEIPGSTYGEYYDTSLAMLALGSGRGGADAPELSDTLTYLFGSSSGRTSEGCWGSIRDSAFIIYAAGWRVGGGGGGDEPGGGPTPIPPETGEANSCVEGFWFDENESRHDTKVEKGYCQLESSGCCVDGYRCDDSGEANESICVREGGGGTTPGVTDCKAAQYFCVSNRLACQENLGNTLSVNDYSCANPWEVCCSVPEPESESCFILGGDICDVDERCSIDEVSASDGLCCQGTCGERGDGGDNGGDEDECSLNSDCPDGKVCDGGSCVAEEEGSSLVLIIVLVVLIIFVILGIIYRNKLRVWWFKMRGKAKSSKIGPRGPPGAGLRTRPSGFVRRGPPAFGARGIMRRPLGSPAVRPAAKSAKDKEMDETLRKLKEMSK